MIIILILVALQFSKTLAYCTSDTSMVKYKIYNNNSMAGVSLGPGTVVPNEDVYVFIHAWQNTPQAKWMLEARQGLRTVYPNSNVIVVDYGFYSMDLVYQNTMCKCPHIGVALADILTGLGVDTAITRCTGMSLGAQICGFFGRRVVSGNLPKLRRITGLDAAGPGFDPDNLLPIPVPWAPDLPHVKSGDAQQVVGIYSDGSGRGLGMKTIYADYNIFVNGGEFQPCPLLAFCVPFNVLNPKPCIFCRHIFAREMYVRHLQGVQYTVTKCTSYADYSTGQCSTPSFIYSEEVPDGAVKGNYFLALDANYNQIG